MPRHPVVGSFRYTRGYRPCLLRWVRDRPSAAVIERMRRAAHECDPHIVLVSLDTRAQALLVPESSPQDNGSERLDAGVAAVLRAVRSVRPEAELRTLVGDPISPKAGLPLVAAQLRRLAGLGDRRHSLASLLETIDPRQASAFVEGQLATLRAYDREHGTDLQRVLELALDHQNRNTAAQAAFMHRNTFRRQLAKALELIDSDLSCPDERLALHVALKLRKPAAPSVPRR
jgi:DNA-binding PucR family transcriptional regulator